MAEQRERSRAAISRDDQRAVDFAHAAGFRTEFVGYEKTDVLTAIKDGKMDFAIDQQQFLQGYLPIVILTNYAETRNLPTGDGTGLIMTGPGFVTKSNAARVAALASRGPSSSSVGSQATSSLVPITGSTASVV